MNEQGEDQLSHPPEATFHNAPAFETNSHDHETMPTPEQLLHDPGTVTISLRRHSEYDKGTENPEMRGSLARVGIDLARESASRWAGQLPDGSAVAIAESPSYMPVESRRHDEATGEVIDKQIEPARARTTASIYETGIFGPRTEWDPTQMRNSDGSLLLTRRLPDERLGDIFGAATNGPKIGEFYGILRNSKYAGKLGNAFWEDYINNKLDRDLANAITATDGGADSLKLAQNVTDFVSAPLDAKAFFETDQLELDDEASASVNRQQKHVELAITHAETIGSFTHYLGHYLQQHAIDEQTEDFIRLTSVPVSFNEGVDVHVSGESMTVVASSPTDATGNSEQAYVVVQLSDFRTYLDSLRTAKDSGDERADG